MPWALAAGGIAGFVGSDPELLERMLASIVHRGPDDEGFFTDEHAALAMRRLSIIDVSGGHQPIESRDGNLVIVFNGEIYNFQELREPFERAGYPFKTRSDTEVILALYEKEGPECVKRLRGMFAIAILDLRRRAAYVIRDRLGLKPVVYTHRDDGFAFVAAGGLIPAPSPQGERRFHASVMQIVAKPSAQLPRGRSARRIPACVGHAARARPRACGPKPPPAATPWKPSKPWPPSAWKRKNPKWYSSTPTS